MMKRDVLVYISGPMTANNGKSIEEHVAAGVKVYLHLLQHGVPAFCPHLSGAFPSAWSVLSHDQWLAYDEAIIDHCTHLLMLPGWEYSKGAMHEYRYASAFGKPIALSEAALFDMLNIGRG